MTILITYASRPNANERAANYLPSVVVNGHRMCSSYATVGYSETDALAEAKAIAEREAARYVGDWDVRIEQAH